MDEGGGGILGKGVGMGEFIRGECEVGCLGNYMGLWLFLVMGGCLVMIIVGIDMTRVVYHIGRCVRKG